jgi:hypothetical protein
MGFLGSLFGSDQRKDINRANKKATAALNKGEGQLTDQYGRAIGELDPYSNGGQQGFEAYLAALGLRGDDARRAVQESYFNDPAFTGQNDLAQNALLRQLNARGVSDSGQQRLASARVLQEGWNNHLARLQGVGDTGLKSSAVQGGFQQGLGDSYMNLAATRAGQTINHGNALAAARTASVNNIIGAVTGGAKAVAGFM